MKDKKTDNQDDIEATAAIENLLAMREDVAASDARNMTLADINAEIAAYRELSK